MCALMFSWLSCSMGVWLDSQQSVNANTQVFRNVCLLIPRTIIAQINGQSSALWKQHGQVIPFPTPIPLVVVLFAGLDQNSMVRQRIITTFVTQCALLYGTRSIQRKQTKKTRQKLGWRMMVSMWESTRESMASRLNWRMSNLWRGGAKPLCWSDRLQEKTFVAWFDTIRYDMIRYGTIRYGTIRRN